MFFFFIVGVCNWIVNLHSSLLEDQRRWCFAFEYTRLFLMRRHVYIIVEKLRQPLREVLRGTTCRQRNNKLPSTGTIHFYLVYSNSLAVSIQFVCVYVCISILNKNVEKLLYGVVLLLEYSSLKGLHGISPRHLNIKVTR